MLDLKGLFRSCLMKLADKDTVIRHKNTDFYILQCIRPVIAFTQDIPRPSQMVQIITILKPMKTTASFCREECTGSDLTQPTSQRCDDAITLVETSS